MSFSGKSVAVVGATGFIGSHLIDGLVASGANVLAIARSESRRKNLVTVNGRYEFAACDLVASPELGLIFQRFRPEVVYHLAARPDAGEDLTHMEASLQVNTMGTLSVLAASVSSGAKRVVYGGSSKVFGHHRVPSTSSTPMNPLSSYAIAKAAGWQACKLISSLHELACVCLHPAFVYGPRQNWNLLRYIEDCVQRGESVNLQGGGQTRDPLYISDVVEAYMAAGMHDDVNGESIPVGGGIEVPVSDLARKILEALGEPGWPLEIGGQQPRATEIWRNYTDNDDAYRLLGWRPKVTLEEGLRLTFNKQPVREHPSVGQEASAGYAS